MNKGQPVHYVIRLELLFIGAIIVVCCLCDAPPAGLTQTGAQRHVRRTTHRAIAGLVSKLVAMTVLTSVVTKPNFRPATLPDAPDRHYTASNGKRWQRIA